MYASKITWIKSRGPRDYLYPDITWIKTVQRAYTYRTSDARGARAHATGDGPETT